MASHRREGSVVQAAPNKWRVRWARGKGGSKVVRGTRREAERYLRERLNERDQGQLLPSQKPLRETIEAWLRHKEPDLRENSLSNYRCVLGHVFDHPIADVPLARLTPQRLSEFFADLAEAGRGGRTRQAVYTRLGSVLAWAVRMRSLAANPLAPVARPKAPRPKPRALERETLKRILEAAAENPLTDCFANLALDTGLRRGELFGLRWGDLQGNQLRIERAATVVRGRLAVTPLKSEAAYRTVTLPEATLGKLRRYRRSLGVVPLPTSFVFPGKKGLPRHPERFRRQVWLPLLERAGVEDHRLHELRHTHVTMLLEEGADWALVGARLGHASPTQTFQTYAHVRRGQDLRAADLVDRARGRL